MDLPRIDNAIADGSFAANAALARFVAAVKASGGTAHLAGLASPGGVHAHQRHIVAAARAMTAAGVPVAVHAFLDGRDVPPKSADGQIAELDAALPAGARIATVSGRFYAMDRDKRWDRVALALAAMLRGEGARAASAVAAVAAGYARGETDEFVDPDGDRRLCRRAGRRRALLRQLPRRPGAADPRRAGRPGVRRLPPGPRPRWAALLGMVEYSDRLNRLHAGDVPGGGHRQHARRLGGGPRPAPVPAGGDREVPARHLLPQRRRRDARAGRGAAHGAEPEGAHLRPRARRCRRPR